MNKESESSLLALSGLSLTLLNITITTMVIERVPILYMWMAHAIFKSEEHSTLNIDHHF